MQIQDGGGIELSELNEMQDILVYEGFNEMRMCICFELYYVFFYLE